MTLILNDGKGKYRFTFEMLHPRDMKFRSIEEPIPAHYDSFTGCLLPNRPEYILIDVSGDTVEDARAKFNAFFINLYEYVNNKPSSEEEQ